MILPAAAVAAEPPDIESLWPLYYHRQGAERSELELLGPLVYRQKSPEGSAWGLRPLFGVRTEAKHNSRSTQVLYPLATFTRSDLGTRHFVFPFYFHNWRLAPNGRPSSATVIFPFFWWGESPEHGKWGFVLFVGGTLRGLLGADVIYYNGFTYTKVVTGDTVTTHIISPIYSRTRGPEKNGVRVWPFYGRTELKGKWWNGYVMWPFCTYGAREASPTKPAADYFASFPFYGRARGHDGRSGSLMVLWPLFYYGWNDHSGLREWRGPWPFCSTVSGRDQREVNLWPFWGRTRYKGRTDTRLLSSLIHWTNIETKDTRAGEFVVLPFFRHSSSESRSRGTRRSFWELWPFWRSRSRQEGDERWGDARSPQLGWVRPTEDFDRHYSALLGLYEHERQRDGEWATRLLARLVRFEGGRDWRHVQLGPLASWHTSPGLTRASFLLGLVQTGRREGKRGWRIFHVPFGAPLSPRSRSGQGQTGHAPAEGKPHEQ